MSKSRRQFLTHAPLALLGAAVASYGQTQNPTELPPGTPPAFGTGPLVGPEVSPATFAEAEKLVQVELSCRGTRGGRRQLAQAMAPLYERRIGPRKVALESTLSPATRWNPMLPGEKPGPASDQFVRSRDRPGPLPSTMRTLPSRP